MTDHIASADKKAPTIIDRICEALEADKEDDDGDYSDGFDDAIEHAIDIIRRIAADGATEGEIEGVMDNADFISKIYSVPYESDDIWAQKIAKAAINVMLGRE